MILIASLMIPTEMTIVPMFVGFLKVRLTNSYIGLILPTIAPVLSVYIFRQFFLGLPEELEDAARIDGASRFGDFLAHSAAFGSLADNRRLDPALYLELEFLSLAIIGFLTKNENHARRHRGFYTCGRV